MQAALRPTYAGKVRRRKAAHWAAFLPIKRAACPMFGTNRPHLRCRRGEALSARRFPARVPQDAAFPEKQKADRPRRGVMRPEPPHRAGFLCRLPVFRVLTAWQAKGRPKSVRFCADYKKAGGFTPSASGTAARRKALSGLRAGGRLLRTGQGGPARADEQQAGKRQAAKHCVSSCRGRTSMAKVPRARAHWGSAFVL